MLTSLALGAVLAAVSPAVALILLALVFRSLGVALCLLRTPLDRRPEGRRFFCVTARSARYRDSNAPRSRHSPRPARPDTAPHTATAPPRARSRWCGR